MNNRVISIEQIVMSYAIKYNTLWNFIRAKFIGSKYAQCDRLNFFIDLDRIFYSINKEVMAGDQFAISASILNLCAHYKSFFRRGYSTEIKIYLVSSTKQYPLNKIHLKDYSYRTGNVPDSNIVSVNKNLLTTIVPYLDNIEYVTTEHESALMIMDILKYHSEDIPSIILTKDIFNWQLVNAEPEKVSILYPKKYNGDDCSFLVDYTNIIPSYMAIRKNQYDPNRNISPSLYPLLLALSRVPERNIKSFASLPKAIKIIQNGIDNFIINGDIGFNRIPFTMEQLLSNTKLDPFVAKLRYEAINILSQYQALEFTHANRYEKGVTLTDQQGVEEISAKYYRNSPVDFPSLL